MTPLLVFGIVGGYFLMLIIVAILTSRKSDSLTFFTGNRNSPWFLVAFGMIGTTISGITFVSVPGEVGNSAFSYLQFALGNLVGYWLVALVLLPLYYRLQLVSIYTFLEKRLGPRSHKTGSFFFLLSKLIGASFRLYLVAGVLQIAFFNAFHIPFAVTVMVTIGLILIYTFKGGVKTIVWTDSIQTLFFISAVIFTIFIISNQMNWDFSAMATHIANDKNSKIFIWEWYSGNNFFKQFFAGIFVTIAIVGMDQDMMQKNLTCKTLKDAQKNMFVFSFSFLITVFLFLCLGVLLYVFAEKAGISIPAKTDDLFPILALKHLGLPVGIAFLLGITAAAYSSADSALTALTTSFSIDFLNIEKYSDKKIKTLKKRTHLVFAALMVVVILLFKTINNESIVVAVFKAVGYTYGPILGLFVFAIFTTRRVNDYWVPVVAILSPVICFLISKYSSVILFGYEFGFELLIVNGLITFGGLWLLSDKNKIPKTN